MPWAPSVASPTGTCSWFDRLFDRCFLYAMGSISAILFDHWFDPVAHTYLELSCILVHSRAFLCFLVLSLACIRVAYTRGIEGSYRRASGVIEGVGLGS